MHIAIRSTENQKNELLLKGFSNEVIVEWLDAGSRFQDIKADAFFDLLFDDACIESNELVDNTLVFVHAVCCTCREINKLNYVRLNAWNGFLNRTVTELSCNSELYRKKAEIIFEKLNWTFVFVSDDYGLVAARIIAMIINEAYYALEEKVSTKKEVDTAMKFGTNYPYGPFEWSKNIGLENVVNLLTVISQKNHHYTISALLVQESQQYLKNFLV